MLLTVVLPSPAALAAGRVALVVGNSAYAAIGALPNPGNDATDVAAALGRLGFDVTTVRDADRVGMSEALRVFTRESAGADVSLVFYAGHGLEMDDVNYLVPVDAQLERDTDVRFEAVELDEVLACVGGCCKLPRFEKEGKRTMTSTDDATSAAHRPSSEGHARGFLSRVGGVFSFDTSVYEEVAAAPATFQAVVVIAVAAMLSGSIATIFLFFLVVPLALIGVGLSALLVRIAARLFSGHSASLGEWYRALGFAQAPLVIGLVPFVGSFIALVYWVAAGVAAISSVARIPIGSAILVFLVAGLLPFLLLAGILVLAGGGAMVAELLGRSSV